MTQSTPDPLRDLLQHLSPEARRVLDKTANLEVPTEPARWFLLEVPDVGDSALMVTNDIEDVARHIQQQDGQPVSCFIFFGWQAFITGKPRELRLPDGRRLSVEPPRSPGPVDASGFLGEPDPVRTPEPSKEESGEYKIVEKYVNDWADRTAAADDDFDDDDDIVDVEP